MKIILTEDEMARAIHEYVDKTQALGSYSGYALITLAYRGGEFSAEVSAAPDRNEDYPR